MTRNRVVSAVVVALAWLAGCEPTSADTNLCPASAPLDCGNGSCCPTETPYYCPFDGAPKCAPYAPSDGPGCNGYVLCGGSGGSSGSSGGGGPCAHWSCGGSTQCASVMGAPSGTQCQFAEGQSCAEWCQEYIPGNCVCE